MIFSPQVAITLNSEESAWLVQILLTAYHSEDVECGLDEMQAAFALRLLAGFGIEPEDEIGGEKPIDRACEAWQDCHSDVISKARAHKRNFGG